VEGYGASNRTTLSPLNALIAEILYVMKSGAFWRSMDASGRPWKTVYGHLGHCADAALWDQVIQQMDSHAGTKLLIIDCTHIQIHRYAPLARGKERQSWTPHQGRVAEDAVRCFE
jgi:hypothetical protein